MKKLFQMIPSGFFNCLSSGSSSGVYSDCLQIIYDQYDREISYRISRSHIRDSLAVYLLENHVDFVEEDEKGARKNYNDLANGIIRKFCSKEVGWLEEEHDDATYEKYIIMTEQGILLAEFLQQLRAPEREEFSSYIYNIYNVLKNEEQWSGDPYVEGLRNVYRNAKMLSKSLKRLSTFIKEYVLDMIQRTKGFLADDYDRIMKEIKHKINVYLQIAVGRARFLRNREMDIRGNVEQTLRYITESMTETGWKSELPEEMAGLFLLDRNEFIDTGSIRFPRKAQSIREGTFAEVEELSQEDLRRAREEHERAAYNPYSKEKMKDYLEHVMGGQKQIQSDELPMESKRDLLCALSAAAYGAENGYTIQLEEGYMETNGMILRRFQISKEEESCR